jgi:hypothetical protein
MYRRAAELARWPLCRNELPRQRLYVPPHLRGERFADCGAFRAAAQEDCIVYQRHSSAPPGLGPLRWIALDLATAAKVGIATIRRVEVIDGEISATAANQAALRRALEYAGVEFIDENGGWACACVSPVTRGRRLGDALTGFQAAE